MAFGTRKWTDVAMEFYQRVLFNWHCHTFSDLYTPLNAAERAYLEVWFRIHGQEHRNFNLEGL